MLRIWTVWVLLFAVSARAQPGFDPHYHWLTSGNLIADKNFYLLTALDHAPDLQSVFRNDSVLSRFLAEKMALMEAHISDTCRWPSSLLGGFRYSTGDSLEISTALDRLYIAQKKLFDLLINKQLRPSGYYQLFDTLSNKELLLHAWAQVVCGSNYIIDQYGLGRKLRYPNIDSATYNVLSGQFRATLKELFAWLSEQKVPNSFYAPSRAIAMKLMDLNHRDEPARHEPLEKGLNRAAILKIPLVHWAKYRYAAILLLGSGPELPHVPLSPMGRLRADYAAMRYRKGLAPFIITSGGYVTPFRGQYCEAIEMKRYLHTQYGIPESAIIADPFARHTTTNIRNAARIIFSYGIPPGKPILIISSRDHIASITDPNHGFDKRNLRELGYLPYKEMQAKGGHEAVCYPAIESLQRDPMDPLDP